MLGYKTKLQRHRKKKKKRSRSSEKPQKLDRDQLSNEYTILFNIPCIPEDGKSTQLFRMGVMKYGAYKQIQSARWGINPNALESECLLTLQEINGIAEPKEETASEVGAKLQSFSSKKK